MDFLGSLDPSKLVLYGTGLSFLLTSTPAVAYNFPLFLFGVFVQEQNEAVQSLQVFTGLVVVSAFFDLFSFFKSVHNSWTFIPTILVLILKVPTFFAFSAVLRHRGGELSLGMGGANVQGATVWAMPGGFTSNGRDGYQPVDDDAFIRPHPSVPANPPMPTPPHSHPTTQPPPGSYQNV